MDNNKRAHPRFAVEVDAEFRPTSGKIPARTRDLSRGGMACYAKRALAIGTTVDVALSLVFGEGSLSEPIVLKAQIVWCTALRDGFHQIGTTFVGLTLETRQYLDMFLRYLKEGLDAQDETDDESGGPDDENRFG